MNILQMCGPTGIGFLYGKSELLTSMPPFLGEISLDIECRIYFSRDCSFVCVRCGRVCLRCASW